MHNYTKSYLVFASYVFMIAMVILSNQWIFGWRTIEDASNIPWEILVPAWFTFAIWWVIYLGMLAFAIFQLRKSTLHDSTIQSIRPRVMENFIANWLWLPVATTTNWSWITLLLIGFMFVSLWKINQELTWYAQATATKWYITLPMSIYFGWITVAMWLNIASVVWWLGFADAVQSPWWVWGWIVAALITYIVIFNKLRYLSYISVALWALIWVISARSFDSPVLAWVSVFLFFALLVYIIVRWGQKKVIVQ